MASTQPYNIARDSKIEPPMSNMLYSGSWEPTYDEDVPTFDNFGLMERSTNTTFNQARPIKLSATKQRRAKREYLGDANPNPAKNHVKIAPPPATNPHPAPNQANIAPPPATFDMTTTHIIEEGIEYTKRNGGKHNITFLCKSACSLGCTCQIRVNKFGQKIKYGKHKTACFYKQGVEVPSDIASKLDIETVGQNIKHDMHVQVTKLSENNHVTRDNIWNQVNAEFIAKAGNNYQGMTREEVRKLVHNSHQAKIDGDKIQRVESEFCGTTKKAFLRHSSLFDDDNGIQ